MTQQKLAAKAGLSLPTIHRMEAAIGVPNVVTETMTKVVTALEREGIELIGEGMPSPGGGRGVRLTPAAQKAGPESGK